METVCLKQKGLKGKNNVRRGKGLERQRKGIGSGTKRLGLSEGGVYLKSPPCEKTKYRKGDAE